MGGGSSNSLFEGNSMKTYSRLTLAFLLLILVVPQVSADEPPKDGPYVEYHNNGKKWYEYQYKNGKKEGLETSWDENGKKYKEIQYKDDKEVSRKEF